MHDGTTARAQVVAELCRSGHSAAITSSGPYLHVAGHVTDQGTTTTDHLLHRRRRRPVAGFQLTYRFETDPVKQDLPPNLVRECRGDRRGSVR